MNKIEIEPGVKLVIWATIALIVGIILSAIVGCSSPSVRILGVDIGYTTPWGNTTNDLGILKEDSRD